MGSLSLLIKKYSYNALPNCKNDFHFFHFVSLYNPNVSTPSTIFCANGGYGNVYGTGNVDILNAPSFFSSLIVAWYLVTPSSVCLLDHTAGPVAGLST